MRKIKRRWRVALLFLAVVGTVSAGLWLLHRRIYPYGWSHSCDAQLMGALDAYAWNNGGAYPKGEATPEASLSLLYPDYANEWVLQGKTVPLEVVKAILERGDRLGPDSCGWHYVEGLRQDDDGLALCWDKIGLGHNGERLAEGGHYVLFVKRGREYIEGANWQAFLKEQDTLLKERSEKKAKKAAN
jgi:hypothetical protein